MKAFHYQNIPHVSQHVARALEALDRMTDEEGGVHRWLRADSGELAPISFEITGYALHLHGWLAHVLNADIFAARQGFYRAFLEEWIKQAGDLLPAFEEESDKAYFFDCGIVARALRFAGSPFGEDLARRMVRFHNQEDCILEPIATVNGWASHEQKRWWSTRPGLYQLKAALAWSGMAEHVHFTRMLNSSITIADMQDTEETSLDALHPLAYYVEGLTLASHVYRANIQRGRLASYLKQSTYYRTDALAQYARLATMSGLEPVEAIARLKLLQAASGGFAFSNRPGESFVSAHATIFAIQALIMAELGPTPELGIYQIV